jgi:hypothetical protein
VSEAGDYMPKGLMELIADQRRSAALRLHMVLRDLVRRQVGKRMEELSKGWVDLVSLLMVLGSI